MIKKVIKMTKRNLENIPPGTCVCSICREKKNNIHFQWYLTRNTKDGFRLQVNTNCLPCCKKRGKEVREAEKLAAKLGRPRSSLQYGDKCDCCRKPVYENKASIPSGIVGRWSWQCDHDHDTGEFRGWICKSCNTGFGGLGDDKDSILRASVYLCGDIDSTAKALYLSADSKGEKNA